MPILSWLTRDEDLRAAGRAPYRLLEEAPDLGAGDKDAGNMLIQGDNLDALKALLPFYAGRVKCVYIDPPYNTRSAFEHYDDNLEHSQWLAMMWPRLELLRELLSEDGSIWVSIDDNEAHYLKVIMDEVFGRKNFLGNIVWQHSVQSKNDAKTVSMNHNHILVYGSFTRNLLPREDDHNTNYSNPDNDPRGPWRSGDVRSPNLRANLRYRIKTPIGTWLDPPEKGWRWSEETLLSKIEDGEIRFSSDYSRIIRRIYLCDQKGRVPDTIWLGEEAGTTRHANGHLKELFRSEANFATPKPERLIQRILHIATNPGDLVLDSFLGSGTTAAVAAKMGRRFIGVEMGDHAVTHCVPRLQKVIDGEQGGISESVGWTGGSGFRFYRLGPPAFDADGRIDPNIRFPVLAAHVWFSETGRPWTGKGKSPLLGVQDERAVALLYNGILGDKTPNGGNVLNRETLSIIKDKLARKTPDFDGELIVYAEASSLGPRTFERERIIFRQTPYDVTARK